MIRLLLAGWLLLQSVCLLAADESVQGQLEFVESDIPIKVDMRRHGYTLGDSVRMRVAFSLPGNYSFDPKSLPLPGPLTAWLDLRDLSLRQAKNEDGGQLIQIEFVWQLLGTVTEAQIIHIPQIILRTLPVEVVGKESQQTLVIKVPAQGLYLSPVLPEQLTEDEAARPMVPPPEFDTSTPRTWAIFFLLLAIILMVYGLYLMDKIIWLPRHPGAMTRLERQLRKQKAARQNAFSLADLRLIHRALAQCAGQSLYPDTLDRLFEKAPYLQGEQSAIKQFFHQSWQLFHQDNAVDEAGVPVADTLAWIRRAAIAERVFMMNKGQQAASAKQAL